MMMRLMVQHDGDMWTVRVESPVSLDVDGHGQTVHDAVRDFAERYRFQRSRLLELDPARLTRHAAAVRKAIVALEALARIESESEEARSMGAHAFGS